MQFRFDSVADFIQMSGHGPYVWVCYIAGLIAVTFIILAPARKKRAQAQQAQRLLKLKQSQAQSQDRADSPA
ncbi:MAG: heme exporter protein CcmD [Cellvibrionaceae bacterium]|nr:heme exporter protein CcmD [Cellvibrionaceae bacterium]MCV6625033.1 heme exporter protein CcmD [Cellvibrionaceae bacterium]